MERIRSGERGIVDMGSMMNPEMVYVAVVDHPRGSGPTPCLSAQQGSGRSAANRPGNAGMGLPAGPPDRRSRAPATDRSAVKNRMRGWPGWTP